jgi:quercetin dioxygenase-like cupin family protein
MRTLLITTAAAITVIAAAAIASATPGEGVLGADVLARSAFGGDVRLVTHAPGCHNRRVAFADRRRCHHSTTRTVRAADFAVQQVTIAPRGATGWHTHAGPAIVLVKSGEFTLYDGRGCKGATFKAGQSFVDKGFGHVHIGRNEGSSNVELYVVYITPAGGPLRIDAARPAASTCAF